MFRLWMSSQGSLKLTMESFYNSVFFWIKASGMNLFRTKEAHQISPKIRFEDTSLICSDRERYAETRNPMRHKSCRNGFRRSNRKRNGFGPSSEPIDTSKKVAFAIRRRKRSHNIYVNLFKPVTWW